MFHLGDETPRAWRFEAWTASLDATIFADPSPRNLLEDLTALTGRPPAIADWVLAPRRRGDIGERRGGPTASGARSDELHRHGAALLPGRRRGGSRRDAGRDGESPRHGLQGDRLLLSVRRPTAGTRSSIRLVANGWLVKHADGTPYTVLDPPYNAGMMDFTNPDAVAWYQAQMQQALDDGWDGWMYDFAEYVPMDAVFSNGMSGMEGHNLYPLLYQKAVHDLMEAQRPGDYDVFVRSGYVGPTPFGFAGTGGLVPMVWAGDQSTDFDLADGLPSALMAALNAGMSGIPLWGSDISGYHYIYNPPPDKEVYLRWTELGAFSADMHDENEGAGNGPVSARWHIWDDQERTTRTASTRGSRRRCCPTCSCRRGRACPAAGP